MMITLKKVLLPALDLALDLKIVMKGIIKSVQILLNKVFSLVQFQTLLTKLTLGLIEMKNYLPIC